MNKVEALKACLDGKTVVSTVTRSRLSYERGAFRYHGIVVPIEAIDEDTIFELYVEPPREVTRAEAWAALDEGKVVKLANPAQCWFV